MRVERWFPSCQMDFIYSTFLSENIEDILCLFAPLNSLCSYASLVMAPLTGPITGLKYFQSYRSNFIYISKVHIFGGLSKDMLGIFINTSGEIPNSLS